MTNEQFSREYHLLDRLTQGAVITHHAQSANGAMVMVHFLRGSPDENAGIVRRLDALMPERRARILAVVDVDGATAVVTKFILDFTSFQDWLATGTVQSAPPRDEGAAIPAAPAATSIPAAPPAPSVEPLAAVPTAPTSPSSPGEFTRLFQSTAPALEPQQPIASPPAVASTPAPSPQPSGGPGEFTLLFRGTPPVGAAPVVERPADPPPAPAVQPPPSAAMDQPAQSSRPAQDMPAYAPPAQQPGEFTRMFGAPMPTTETPPLPDPAPPPAPARPSAPPLEPTFGSGWSGFSAPPPQAAPPAAGPGEYTRLFGGAAAPPPAVSVPSPLPPTAPPSSIDWGSPNAPAGSATGDSYFDRLVGGASPPPSGPPAPHAVPTAPPVFSGPSEFTRIISATPPSPALTPPAPRQVVPPPPLMPVGNPQNRGDRVLLFSLVGIVLLAVVLVIVFLVAT